MDPFWHPKCSLLAPIGAQRKTKAGQGASFGLMGKKHEKGVPAGSQKQGSAAQGLDMWGCDKTAHSEQSLAKTLGKMQFRQTSENQGR